MLLPMYASCKAKAHLDSFVRCPGVAVPILYRKYMPIKQKQETQDIKTGGPTLQSINTTFYANKRL